MGTPDFDSDSFFLKKLLLQMILAAIAALGEKEGPNKSAIIKFIEATYSGSLEEGYTAEISDALEKLQDSGELQLVRSHFVKVETVASPRRGRGRPKKPKSVPSPGPAAQTPLRRGRPPKPKGSHAAAVKIAGGISRRRGRPRKKHRPAVVAAPPAGAKGREATAVILVKRKRGRPRKVKPPAGGAADE
ncbi:hypothetical protein KSP40_PGU020609 [Platanthera guangdongensis]|uniref:H15 domain-containing protein n=1 Tax=Platanthera guangdongensis TaxID=2320717 RepID=A0ABR2MHR0_9ASPA